MSIEGEAAEVIASAMIARGLFTQEQRAEADLTEQQGESGRDPQGRFAGPGREGELAMRNRVAAEIASGKWTAEQGDAAVKAWRDIPAADGVQQDSETPKPAGPLAASGAPNPWAELELPPGFEVPATADGYKLEQLVAQTLTTEQLRGIGETLHAARLPAPIATQIVSEIANTAARNLDEKGLRMLTQQTLAQLDRLWGDQREAKVAKGIAFVRELDKLRPGVLQLLEKSGAGSSLAVIRQVVEHAERLEAARTKERT